MANSCFIGLGSNLSDRLGYIEQAIQNLVKSGCIIKNCSSIYETKPYGYTEQNNFLNCVVEISSPLNLLDLFQLTKNIEVQLGREKREKWGPREIDLDILFFNDMIYSDDKLTVPHKDVLNRDFVLIPLCEIAPDFVHPKEGKRICEVSLESTESSIIRKLDYQIS